MAKTPSTTLDINDASLIVTFYGPQADGGASWTDVILDRVTVQFQLEPGPVEDSWYNPESGREVYVRRFDLPAAHDTCVVQLAINEPGPARAGWSAIERRTDGILGEDAFAPIWGYTLTYQAEFADSGARTIDDRTLSEVMSGLCNPFGTTPSHGWSRAIAHASVAGGQTWLMDVPTRADGMGAASVYLALAHTTEDSDFVSRYLYGPSSQLLMPDLIAHKAYHQTRQYSLGSFREQYSTHLDQIHGATHDLLHGLVERGARDAELERLARDYGYLVEAISHLSRLEASLSRQSLNYAWWVGGEDENDVLLYHESRLDTAQSDVRLLIADGRAALEASSTAIDIMRTRLDSERDKNQQLLGVLLAVVAIVLTVPQLIDRQVLRAILEVAGVWVATTPQATLMLVGLQMLIAVLLMVVAGLIVRRVVK